MTEQLVVTVHADGRIEAKTQGTVGAQCLHAIALLEELLSATTTASAYTADYYRVRQIAKTKSGAEETIANVDG